jgi:glutaredoxin 3
MATKVEVYSIVNCPFCIRAKGLLRERGVDFVDHDLTDMPTPELRDLMMRLGGQRTVPLILINGRPIGGCEDLFALDRSGELAKMLAPETQSHAQAGMHAP